MCYPTPYPEIFACGPLLTPVCCTLPHERSCYVGLHITQAMTVFYAQAMFSLVFSCCHMLTAWGTEDFAPYDHDRNPDFRWCRGTRFRRPVGSFHHDERS